MQTREKIEEQLNKAREKMEKLPSNDPDYQHASSVDDALSWVLEWSDDEPMEED